MDMSRVYLWLGWPLILITLISCTGDSTGILSLDSTLATDSYIVLSSWDGNHRSVSYYDINGNYLRHVDFRDEVITPRGLSLLDNSTIIMSGEGNDSIRFLDLQGNDTLFFGASTFNGGIYDNVYDPVGQTIFAIESNGIEAFDIDGTRNTAKYIPTTTGACTLSTPVKMIINSLGQLVVSNVGGSDSILTYDITTTPATCLSSVAFGNNPYAIMEHSNGSLYVATQGDDQIYQANLDGSGAVVVWATDTTIINNPQALGELPNGNIIVSSASRDSIEQITTAGVRVGTFPFIQDPLTLNIGDILVIDGSSQ